MHTPVNHPKTSLGAYFGIFDECYEGAFKVDDIPWPDRIYIAFATLSRDGLLTTCQESDDEKIRSVVRLYRQNHPEGKVLISSNYGNDMDERYLTAAKNSEQFALSALNFMKTYDLDGLDIDWETTGINAYQDERQKILNACHYRFAQQKTPRADRYQLTCTTWPGVESPSTVAKAAQVADLINIMCYGAAENPYGLEDCIKQYSEQGISCKQLSVGFETERGIETTEVVEKKVDLMRLHGIENAFVWRIDNDMKERGLPTFKILNLVKQEIDRPRD